MINKLKGPLSGRTTCLIKKEYDYRPNWMTQSSVTIIIINHNHNKLCDILGFFLHKTQEILIVFLLAVKKKPFKYKHVIACTVQLLRLDEYCPITLSY